MKKKGFTLIEIIVAMVIIISIMLVAIGSVVGISKIKKEEAWSLVKNQIETAAIQYFTSNKYLFENIKNGTSYISVGKLVDTNYLNPVTDPRSSKKINRCSKVFVNYDGKKYTASLDETELSLNGTACDYDGSIIVQENGGPTGNVEFYDNENVLAGPKYNDWFNINSLHKENNKLVVCIKPEKTGSIVSAEYSLNGTNSNLSKTTNGFCTNNIDQGIYNDFKIILTNNSNKRFIYSSNINVDTVKPTGNITVKSKQQYIYPGYQIIDTYDEKYYGYKYSKEENIDSLRKRESYGNRESYNINGYNVSISDDYRYDSSEKTETFGNGLCKIHDGVANENITINGNINEFKRKSYAYSYQKVWYDLSKDIKNIFNDVYNVYRNSYVTSTFVPKTVDVVNSRMVDIQADVTDSLSGVDNSKNKFYSLGSYDVPYTYASRERIYPLKSISLDHLKKDLYKRSDSLNSNGRGDIKNSNLFSTYTCKNYQDSENLNDAAFQYFAEKYMTFNVNEKKIDDLTALENKLKEYYIDTYSLADSSNTFDQLLLNKSSFSLSNVYLVRNNDIKDSALNGEIIKFYINVTDKAGNENKISLDYKLYDKCNHGTYLSTIIDSSRTFLACTPECSEDSCSSYTPYCFNYTTYINNYYDNNTGFFCSFSNEWTEEQIKYGQENSCPAKDCSSTKTFTVTYEKNGVSSIGKESDSCTTTGDSCTVTAPSINAANGYYTLGWSTTSNGKVSVMPGGTITLKSSKKYYARQDDICKGFAKADVNTIKNFISVNVSGDELLSKDLTDKDTKHEEYNRVTFNFDGKNDNDKIFFSKGAAAEWSSQGEITTTNWHDGWNTKLSNNAKKIKKDTWCVTKFDCHTGDHKKFYVTSCVQAYCNVGNDTIFKKICHSATASRNETVKKGKITYFGN